MLATKTKQTSLPMLSQIAVSGRILPRNMQVVFACVLKIVFRSQYRSFVVRCAEVQIGTIASPASLAAGISTASDLSESLRIVRRCQQGGGARQAAMKLVVASKDVAVPEGVKIEVKARKIRVKGPRGEWDTLPANV